MNVFNFTGSTFSIHWNEVLKAVRGDNFEFTGNPDDTFLFEVQKTITALEENIHGRILEDLGRVQNYNIKSAVIKCIKSEDFLDSVIKRIMSKQLGTRNEKF